jgi:L-asparaginase II
LDGNNRANGCVVAEVLRQLGILSKVDLKKMEKFAYPKIKNWSGVEVGYIKADFKLKKHFNLPFVSSETVS